MKSKVFFLPAFLLSSATQAHEPGDSYPSIIFRVGESAPLAQFLDYLCEGVWHIWIGFDHILFLLSLLLPSVLVLTNRNWQPAERFRDTFWDVFKVVTSFTVAHSITLSLAALSVISLPSRLVESTIALSVLLAALNNLRPVTRSGAGRSRSRSA